MRIAVFFVLWLLPLNLCYGFTFAPHHHQQTNTLKWVSSATLSTRRRSYPRFSSLSNDVPDDENEKQIVTNEQTIQGTGEEDECYDLCDIDWDLMPQWNEDDTATSSSPGQQQQSDAAAYLDESLEEEDDEENNDDEEDELINTATKNRLRLEMQWQLWKNEEDCDVTHDVSTCGSYCKDCEGRGWQLCRFCHGKGMVMMGSSAVECIICSRAQKNRDLVGTELCRSCRGTGWVAPWTTLASKL